MDITKFFQIQDKVIHNNTDSKQYSKFIGLLTILKSKEFIDLLEFTYLTNFIKFNSGSLICSNWLAMILNKLNEKNPEDETIKKFTNCCEKIFNNFLTIDKNIFIDSEKLLQNIIIKKKEQMEFTNDQKIGIKNIFTFLNDTTVTTYGLFGTPGSGKTTTITEFVYYLLSNNFINSVALTASTHKATNVLKSKFRHCVISLLSQKFTTYKPNMTLEECLYKLNSVNIKIEFITLHKLLNYKNDYDISGGERLFVRNGPGSIHTYDFIVVDEASMSNFQIITHIFEDIRKETKNSGNYKKIPKVLFSGDPCQLCPVHESKSAIFAKTEEDLSLKLFIQTLPESLTNATEEINKNFEYLKKDILGMKYTMLIEVVRNKISNVINLCSSLRNWVLGTLDFPKIRDYTKGDSVFAYKYTDKSTKFLKKEEKNQVNEHKIDTMWFKQFIENCLLENGNNNNMIITHTNKQADIYNNAYRKIMFKDKKHLEKYEIGDILILNDFYNYDETAIKDKNNNNKNFYTSEQIKVINIERVMKKCSNFLDSIPNKALKIKYSNQINAKYKRFIKQLNTATKREYHVWKLHINRLADLVDKKANITTFHIYVIDDKSIEGLEKDKSEATILIKKFRKDLKINFSEQLKQIDNEIIKSFWREYNNIFINPFANISYGVAISVYKSQGSQYFNVFVDCHDIHAYTRNGEDEKRLIYTAITRSANEIHLLI
ncbi:MAG: UvrD-family helicase [Edafosvirus sp.]|uniref:UvrD-family helicase n=1 Tax=Edafosvirus sp. TaxID=2487765 RepID=A0A3G4ZU30_9VIRU|nr:MAG: UvrD-family helicase [Edafosvirus sp.]